MQYDYLVFGDAALTQLVLAEKKTLFKNFDDTTRVQPQLLLTSTLFKLRTNSNAVY